MSSSSQNPARAHHWMPRHYLKGFASQNEASRIWVYQRDKPFNPGHQPHRHHPLHMPIKKTAMTVDFYACQQQDGTVDYDGYEKALSIRENSDAILLNKIRRGEMPTASEKLRFAAYMLLMSRRTPIHQSQFPAIWSSVLANMRAEDPFLQALEELEAKTPSSNVETLAKIAARRQQYDDIIAQKLSEKPCDKMRLDGMFNESRIVVEMLAEMNWHILRAPQGTGFLAADDPVNLRGGLQHSTSEVVFPLSTGMALVAVWDFKQSICFENANREQMNKVNRAMMCIAEKNIFYFQPLQSLAETFNQNEYLPAIV